MSHLRLVPTQSAMGNAVPTQSAMGNAVPTQSAHAATDDRPRVSLRLLMAASGRCSCDACLIAYRLGDKSAGIVEPRRPAARLTAVH